MPQHRRQRRHCYSSRLCQLPQQRNISRTLFAKAVVLAAHYAATVQHILQDLLHELFRRQVVKALKRRAKHQLHPQFLHQLVTILGALQQLYIAFAYRPVGMVWRFKGKNRTFGALCVRLCPRFRYHGTVPAMDSVKKSQCRHGGLLAAAGKVVEDQQFEFSFV